MDTALKGTKKFSVVLVILALIFSAISLSVPARAAVPSCTTPVIPETARTVGTTLTVTVDCGVNADTISYQWQVGTTSSASSMQDISGATSETLLITQDFFGAPNSNNVTGLYFRVGVTATNADGTSTIKYSTIRSANVNFPAKLFAGSGTPGFADGSASSAQFGNLNGLATDGTYIYTTDSNDRIRKIDGSGNVSTLAGDGTEGRLDGPAASAQFRNLRQITYSSSQNKLFVKDDAVIRIVDLTTNQVSTMLNQASPASWSQSSSAVTLTFAKPHGFYAGNTVTVAGVGANLDGERTIASTTSTTIRINVSNSASVSSTALVGATVTGEMGDPSRTDTGHWFAYNNAFQVSPDGHIYLSRSNSGDAATNSKTLRFKQISGDTFSFEIVAGFNSLICSISFESATVMYANTCGSTSKYTTADDWATVTAAYIGAANTALLRTSGDYLYSGRARYDVSQSPPTGQGVFGSEHFHDLIEFGDDVLWIDDFSFYTNAIYIFEGGVSGTTTTNPSLSSSSPADNSTDVSIASGLTLNFSKSVVAGSGNISLYRSNDPSNAVHTIDVTGAGVNISGSSVQVTWPQALETNTQYFVLVDSTAFVDSSGNAFAGIASDSVLNFTTIGLPTLASSTPSDNATNVPNDQNIVLNFSRNVVAVAGKNITLVNTDTSGTTVISANSAQVSISGSQVTIDPANDLDIASNYAITLDAGAFEDANGLGVAAITDPSVLNFVTDKVPHAGLEVALDASNTASYSGTGATWTDLSGSGNHVTLYGSPSFNSTDKALVFSSASLQYGDFAAQDLLNNAAYTKLVWFKPTGLTAVNNLFSSRGTNAHAFWGGGNNPDCTDAGDNLAAGHNGQWYAVTSDECLEAEWQLGAVSFSNVDGWRLYRNGEVVGSSTDTTEISVASAGYYTQIARYSTSYYFDGEIGQVYLYGRALSQAEINAVFEASASQYGLNLKSVIFDPNGGSVDIPTLKTNAGDGAVTLRSPTRGDDDFLGWYTASTGGTRVGGSGEGFTPVSDITLYAQWDARHVVTYSAGTNATGAPASANFLASTGPVSLPTPSRADYVFDGWYSASTGGVKIGNAGADYTPSADVTLHGRWTQASLAGIPEADRTLINTAVTTNGVSSTNTLTIGSSSVAVTIPGNAFATGVEVRTYSVANHNKAQALLPNESDFVNSMVVAWTAPDTTVPVANSPLTMVITDASIKSGAKVFSIVGDQTTLLATATQDGQVTISFTTDPLITIANPVVVPPPSTGGGGGGGGTPAPAPAATPIAAEVADVPTVTTGQEFRIKVNQPTEISIKGENLRLITKVQLAGEDLKFEVSEDGTELVLSLVRPDSGVETISLFHGKEVLEQQITVEPLIERRVNAGSFNGVVALYAKGYIGQRFSAKVGKDWVIVDSLADDYVRIVEPTRWVGHQIRVRIFIDRRLVNIIDLVTR